MKLRLFSFIFLLLGAGVLQAAETAANIVFAAGGVSIESPDGTSRPAERGGELKSGETINTASDGRVQLRFRDGGSFSLQPASRFRVDDFRYGGQDGGRDDRSFFSLLRGGFRTVSGLIGKQFREQYQVKTSVATIGIRGTAYNASLNDDVLRVNTIQGLVEVCSSVACMQIGQGEGLEVLGRDQKPVRTGSGTPVSDPALPNAPPPPSVAPQETPGAQQPHRPQGGGYYPGGGQYNPAGR